MYIPISYIGTRYTPDRVWLIDTALISVSDSIHFRYPIILVWIKPIEPAPVLIWYTLISYRVPRICLPPFYSSKIISSFASPSYPIQSKVCPEWAFCVRNSKKYREKVFSWDPFFCDCIELFYESTFCTDGAFWLSITDFFFRDSMSELAGATVQEVDFGNAISSSLRFLSRHSL